MAILPDAVAIIPARGGSKRLPRKNVMPFRGKPMIAHTIEAALESGVFTEVVVSSDDAEILTACAGYPVRALQRPADLGSDTARVVDVCIHVLKNEISVLPEVFACLYATAPLRTAADIRAAVGLVVPGRCDFAMAVTAYPLPPHQALKRGEDGSLSPMWPELVNRRDDEIGALAVDNGSTYACASAAFIRQRSFYGPGLKGHMMPASRSVDINTADDLALAEFYAERAAA